MSFKHVAAALLMASGICGHAFGQALILEKKPDALVQAGDKLYAENCAKCHDRPTDRIPPKQAIAILKTPDEIIEKLTTGTMRYMAELMTPEEVKTLAHALSNRVASPQDQTQATCARRP